MWHEFNQEINHPKLESKTTPKAILKARKSTHNYSTKLNINKIDREVVSPKNGMYI